MTTRLAIEASGVGYTFERWGHRVRALENVTTTINQGEWVLVVGPNGSGKSTLLKLFAGQLRIQEGDVRICGQSLGTGNGRRMSDLVFLVHQDPRAGTAPALTVGEHLVLAEASSNLSRKALRERQMAHLDAFQLQVDIAQPVETLSGGQRQLLCLLLAKLRPAPVILLDEPFAALDEDRQTLCERAIGMLHEAGKTLVMVTHDLAFAAFKGDRTIGLDRGRIVSDKVGELRAISTERVAFQSAYGPAIQASRMADDAK